MFTGGGRSSLDAAVVTDGGSCCCRRLRSGRRLEAISGSADHCLIAMVK